jgi:hypothetical protein
MQSPCFRSAKICAHLRFSFVVPTPPTGGGWGEPNADPSQDQAQQKKTGWSELCMPVRFPVPPCSCKARAIFYHNGTKGTTYEDIYSREVSELITRARKLERESIATKQFFTTKARRSLREKQLIHFSLSLRSLCLCGKHVCTEFVCLCIPARRDCVVVVETCLCNGNARAVFCHKGAKFKT